MGNHTRKLGGDSDQERFFIIGKAAPRSLLHYEHPQKVPLMHNRRTQEG